MLRQYTEIFSEYENKGYIRRITVAQPKNLRFIPHHPVLSPKKPGRLRIVFDCAAKSGGFSLNDCILSGPDLTNDITGVLLRFRMHQIAVSADIEEMFLQVGLPPEDRAPFSFFWYPDGDLQKRPEIYQFNVHPFGVTSSPFCAAFALRCVSNDNRMTFDEKTI